MVKDTLNPFDNNLENERLFNLGTGKVDETDTEQFLLNIKSLAMQLGNVLFLNVWMAHGGLSHL